MITTKGNLFPIVGNGDRLGDLGDKFLRSPSQHRNLEERALRIGFVVHGVINVTIGRERAGLHRVSFSGGDYLPTTSGPQVLGPKTALATLFQRIRVVL